MEDLYTVKIMSPADVVVIQQVISGALNASEYMESKLAELPDGYWGHIQVIGGNDDEKCL